MPIAKETVYLNQEQTETVDEGTEGAVFLLARAGTYVSEADAQRWGLEVDPDPVYDAVADHEAKHGGETDGQAQAKRQAMLAGQEDPDGPPVEGERGEKRAAGPSENKAAQPAEDKADEPDVTFTPAPALEEEVADEPAPKKGKR